MPIAKPLRSNYDPITIFKGLVHLPQKKQAMTITSRTMTFEVDFDIFKARFFPKVVMTTKLSPLVVWTEICSEIKGRVDSCKYECGGIPPEQYIQTQNVISLLLSMAEQNVFFSGDTAQTIAKGVGFRFYDLKKVFEKYDYENSESTMR